MLSNRRALRVVFFIFLYLLLLDKALGVLVVAPFFEDNYRLPRNSQGENIAPFLEHIKAFDKDETVIVFTGDSVVSGVNIEESRYTLPYQFLGHLNSKAKVYNLAISGSTLADQYLVIKSLGDSADIVFFNIHYQFFNSKYPKRLEHEGLVNLEGITQTDIEELGPIKGNKILYFIRHNLLKWSLLRNQYAITQRVFGGSPREFIETKYSSKPTRIEKNDALDTRSFSELPDAKKSKIVTGYKKNFDVGRIEESNVNLAYARKIASLAAKSNAVFIGYMNPINPDLIDDLEIDEEEYKENVRLIRTALEGSNIVFLDYNFLENQAVSPANYHDADHFIKEGAEELAKRLYEDSAERGVIK